MTDEELKTLAGEWKDRLRLLHWETKTRFVRAYDLPPDKGGLCCREDERLEATIRILVESDWPEDCFVSYDAEEILVHELLHLMNRAFWKSKQHIEEEAVINRLAHALVQAKRGTWEKENKKNNQKWIEAHQKPKAKKKK